MADALSKIFYIYIYNFGNETFENKMHRLEGASIIFIMKNSEALLADIQSKFLLVCTYKTIQYEDERLL